jgi:hypothetical protein
MGPEEVCKRANSLGILGLHESGRSVLQRRVRRQYASQRYRECFTSVHGLRKLCEDQGATRYDYNQVTYLLLSVASPIKEW